MDCEVTFQPSGRKIKVFRGSTVLQAARKAGIVIPTRCGGNASCFMCKVIIKDDQGLQPIQEKEKRKLLGIEVDGTRLACQAIVTGKVTVELPLDPYRLAILKQLNMNHDDSLW